MSEEDQTFITGVDIDFDQWREQTISELNNWIIELQNKKTEFGDNLVDFPPDWDKEEAVSFKQQLDNISNGLSKKLNPQEKREAQTEIQAIRQQADKLRQLDKLSAQLDSDSDSDSESDAETDSEDILSKEIIMPVIDTSGPNPFEITEDVAKRLKEIDEKLSGSAPETTKTIDQINEELSKLY